MVGAAQGQCALVQIPCAMALLVSPRVACAHAFLMKPCNLDQKVPIETGLNAQFVPISKLLLLRCLSSSSLKGRQRLTPLFTSLTIHAQIWPRPKEMGDSGEGPQQELRSRPSASSKCVRFLLCLSLCVRLCVHSGAS